MASYDTKQLYSCFTGFISYTVIDSKIYMISFGLNITDSQKSLCCSSVRHFVFTRFTVTVSHKAKRYLQYYYILFHQTVNFLSKQTCMIGVTQHDVKIPAGNPAVVPCYCLHPPECLLCSYGCNLPRYGSRCLTEKSIYTPKASHSGSKKHLLTCKNQIND